jgi:hypothetical protein
MHSGALGCFIRPCSSHDRLPSFHISSPICHVIIVKRVTATQKMLGYKKEGVKSMHSLRAAVAA